MAAEITQNIIETNHTKDKICMELEAHDYGTNVVIAHLSYQRLFTTTGESVKEDTESYILPMETPEGETISKLSYTIDLSDDKYEDGMYKIELYLTDATNNKSAETKVFYVVRDTNHFAASSSGINTALQDYKHKDEKNNLKYIPIAFEDIEEAIGNVCIYHYSDDVFMTYNNVDYKTPLYNLDFYISYGLSPAEEDLHRIPEPLKFIPNITYNTGNFNATSEAWIPQGIINYTDEITDFIKEHEYSNIYIELTIADAVGNIISKSTYVPGKVTFLNYSFNNENKLILNFDNKQGINFKKIFNTDNIDIQALTRIYYTDKTETASDGRINYHRNFLYDLAPEDLPMDPDTGERAYDPRAYDNFDDPPVIEGLNPDKEYKVIIQTAFVYSANGNWFGTIYGRPCIVDNISKANQKTDNSFGANLQLSPSDVTKEILGKNTGLSKITINNANFNESGVSYLYGYSADDGATWNYYTTNSFTVDTPIKAPVHDWYNEGYEALTDKENLWEIGSEYDNIHTHTAVDLHPHMDVDYETKVLVKVIASKAGYNNIKETATQEVIFNQSDDNIPPKITTNKDKHDLVMSADGAYIYCDNGIFLDNEWNDPSEVTYYYTQFQPYWEKEFDVLSAGEIEKLPGGKTEVYYSTWTDYWDEAVQTHSFQHTNMFYIPIDGLSDGDWMFFLKATDRCGNSSTGGIGKFHIGTFKNKLSASYKDGIINASLKLSSGENFSDNHIFVQYYDETDSEWKMFQISSDKDARDNGGFTSTEKYKREVNYYALNKMTVDAANNKITFASNVNPTVEGHSNFKNVTLPENSFYKLIASGYNYNKDCNSNGLNFRISEYGAHDSWILEGKYDYDAWVDETVSYPAYIYVPTPSGVKHTFDPDNVRIMSNKPVLVNIISTSIELTNSADEWERRGKIISTETIQPDSNGEIDETYDVLKKVYEANEKGSHFYVATVHYADGTSSVSKVFKTN